MSRKKHKPSKRVSVYVPDKDFNYVDPFDSGVCEECKWRTGREFHPKFGHKVGKSGHKVGNCG